jgi:hypothetical protein
MNVQSPPPIQSTNGKADWRSKKRISKVSHEMKLEKIRKRKQFSRIQLKTKLDAQMIMELQQRVKDFMVKYYLMLSKGLPYILIDNFFTPKECTSIKNWIIQSYKKFDAEVINFPEGGFDSIDSESDKSDEEENDQQDLPIDVSTATPEKHRFQSTKLIIAKELTENDMEFLPGDDGVDYDEVLASCPPCLKEFTCALHRTDQRFAYYVLKSLVSYRNGRQQWFHSDDAADLDKRRIDRDSLTHSVIISLEPNSNKTFIHGAEYDPKDKLKPKYARNLINEIHSWW